MPSGIKKHKTALLQTIKRLRKEIAEKINALERYESIYELHYGAGGLQRGKGDRRAVGGRVDWNHMLKDLPMTFTVDDLVKKPALKIKSRAYLKRVLLRLAEENKLTSLGAGRFSKRR